jgi:hypothetical protein
VEKYVFLSLGFTNRDDKSAWGNGKRLYVQDCIGWGKSCYNNFHINNTPIPNTLIDLGAIINFMMKETMEKLQFSNP